MMRISIPFVATNSSGAKNRNVVFLLITGAFIIIVLTWLQDFLRAYLKESAYYFSESLLFSAFWWIFVPLLFAQYRLITAKQSLRITALLIGAPVLIHAVLFPFLVRTISGIFYAHTFVFQQTLRYTLAEHGYQLILIYSVPFLIYRFIDSKKPEQHERPVSFLDKIPVSTGGKKYTVSVQDIFYVSSATPYVSIHTAEKKYLYNETLKSIAGQLNPEQFVRVHKSTVVNVGTVLFYTSRLNGDYDISLKNGVRLRVSRNFALSFKQCFRQTHPLTT